MIKDFDPQVAVWTPFSSQTSVVTLSLTMELNMEWMLILQKWLLLRMKDTSAEIGYLQPQSHLMLAVRLGRDVATLNGEGGKGRRRRGHDEQEADMGHNDDDSTDNPG